MDLLIRKNESPLYQLFDHSVVRDKGGDYFCRAAKAVLWDGISFCMDCPLRKGDFPYNSCSYFDLDISAQVSAEEGYTPEMELSRTDGMIAAGLTGVFPEFVEEDGSEAALLIEKAIRFAAEAHKGAKRKGNNIPYIVHPMETMGIVSRMTDDVDVICAAALHDVIEDTPTTPDQLSEIFGERIAFLVVSESENKREGLPKNETWHIRKEENLIHIKDAPVESKMIMLADKVSNMRSTVRDFRVSGDQIWEKFNMKDEAQQAWYYKSVAHVLKELSYLSAYQEYVYMLEEVFEGVDTPTLIC